MKKPQQNSTSLFACMVYSDKLQSSPGDLFHIIMQKKYLDLKIIYSGQSCLCMCMCGLFLFYFIVKSLCQVS